MIYIYKFECGELECELEYYSEEKGACEAGTGLQLEPDYPADVMLMSAKFKGVDFLELLSDEVVKLIEEKALISIGDEK